MRGHPRYKNITTRLTVFVILREIQYTCYLEQDPFIRVNCSTAWILIVYRTFLEKYGPGYLPVRCRILPFISMTLRSMTCSNSSISWRLMGSLLCIL